MQKVNELTSGPVGHRPPPLHGHLSCVYMCATESSPHTLSDSLCGCLIMVRVVFPRRWRTPQSAGLDGGRYTCLRGGGSFMKPKTLPDERVTLLPEQWLLKRQKRNRAVIMRFVWLSYLTLVRRCLSAFFIAHVSLRYFHPEADQIAAIYTCVGLKLKRYLSPIKKVEIPSMI